MEMTMLKRIISALLLLMTVISSVSAFTMPDKIYVDSKEMDTTQDRFRIHLGHNVWVEANTMYRDESGMFTLESNLIRGMGNGIAKDVKGEYERTWKCPYCYKYWPVGQACQNKDCPSKYK